MYLNFLADAEEQLIDFNNLQPLDYAVFVVVGLILIVGLFSCLVECYLAIKYVKFNRKDNSRNITGLDAARQILDHNDLQKIKIKCTGSMIWGNSYSHYFKKLRLRRFTYKKTSVTSLGIAAEKACLAILDKEGDKDMKKRNFWIPLQFFGPFLTLPIIFVGLLIDVLVFNVIGVFSILGVLFGLAVFVSALVVSILTLRTEKKAQNRAYEVLRQENLATEQEIEMLQELFRLYNIEYINHIILEILQIILKILEIALKVRAAQAKTGSSN